MKEPCQHLLDIIYPNNSLLLLEAMIPYVDQSLKLPLVLLIKIQEVQLLIQAFQNPARMEACGLNRSMNSSEEMISVLCQAMGIDYDGQIKNMMNMMNMMNTMNNMNASNASDIMNQMKNENGSNMMNNEAYTNIMNMMNAMNSSNSSNTEGSSEQEHSDTSMEHFSDERNHSDADEYFADEVTHPDNFQPTKDTRNDMIDAIRQLLSEQEGDSYES